MPNADLVLLDTHAWVWLSFGDLAAFRRASAREIGRAGAQGRLRVAAISVWEVGVLVAKGRIQLGVPLADWVKRALAAPGLTLCDLAPEVAVESNSLPGDFHADPADRMIVATARIIGATLYTKDRAILAYARRGHVSAAAL
jgi:PIN domain nuclease of toxin-antitoxin system